jgi:hypothetical protein
MQQRYLLTGVEDSDDEEEKKGPGKTAHSFQAANVMLTTSTKAYAVPGQFGDQCTRTSIYKDPRFRKSELVFFFFLFSLRFEPFTGRDSAAPYDLFSERSKNAD